MNKIIMLLLSVGIISLIDANNDLPQEIITALMLKRHQTIKNQNDAIAQVSGSIVNCLSAAYALPDHRMLKNIFDALDENDAWDLSQVSDDYDYPKYIANFEELSALQKKYQSMSYQDIEAMGTLFAGMHIVYTDKQRPHIAHIG